MKDILEKKIFPFVDKPSRYIGGEWNSIVRKERGKINVALVYPDVYEVGISNLGIKILYNILNSMENVVCERAYAPWTDMENLLRENKIPLFSLESKRSLKEFDIIGFTFQYELVYTNFLNVLDLCGISFYSNQRGEGDPFIIGGGPISGNPEPVAPFLDAICIGDGESRIVEIVKFIGKGREDRLSRHEIMEGLSKIEGVYVPLMYKEIKLGGYIYPEGKKVKRFIEKDIEQLPFPTKQIIPNLLAVQDRAVMEVSRGCTRGCRFCQAGILYRPVRERSVVSVLELARKAILETGYREFSLLSLSISDYNGIDFLIEVLHRQFSPHGISFSLPSLRIDSFTLELAKKVREIRKSGLTFAVEGGSSLVRKCVNKNVSEEELMEVISMAQGLGWRRVKLYFMIGLCPEEDEISGIADLLIRLEERIKEVNITASVAVFIPKAHTPFQWNEQMNPERAEKNFQRLVSMVKKKRRINIRYHNPYISWLEGIFSRGDRGLARVIELSFLKGCRFDGWTEKFNVNLWKDSFKESGIDPDFYLSGKEVQTIFPWEIVDIGVKRDFLIREKDKSEEGEITPDCRENCYNACGSCDFNEIKPVIQAQSEAGIDVGFLSNVKIDSEPDAFCRWRYCKIDDKKYISPVDLEEIFVKALIRANLPVVFTRGFNPHIKIEMGWALPVGFSSIYEVAEVNISKKIEGRYFMEEVNCQLPDGIKVLDAKVLSLSAKKLGKVGREQIITFSFDNSLSEDVILKNLKQVANFKKVTFKGEKVIDLGSFILEWKIEENRIKISYVQKEGGARIQDIIQAFTGYNVRKAVLLNPLVEEREVIVNKKRISLFDL